MLNGGPNFRLAFTYCSALDGPWPNRPQPTFANPADRFRRNGPGRCDSCGSWNSFVEEQAAAPVSGAKGQGLPKGKASRLVGLRGRGSGSAPHHDRHCGARPGRRRRFRARLRRADRRRSRHRQIDAAVAGAGRTRPQGKPRHLHLRRRSHRPGAAAGPAPWPR